MFSELIGDCVGKQDAQVELHRFRMWLKRNGESVALMCLGVIMTSAVLIALYELFTAAPIITEEAELVTRVTQRTMQHRCEWTSPESWSTQMHLAAMSNSMHVSMYKLKVIVIVDALRLFEMKRVLQSLTRAVYNNREHSIDLEVIVLNAYKSITTTHASGNANINYQGVQTPNNLEQNKEGNKFVKNYAISRYEHILDHVHWPHGRYEVVLREEESASQLPLSTLWYPTSLWELVLFLDDSYTISPMWYFYVTKMISEYIADKGYYSKYIQLNQRITMSELRALHQDDSDVSFSNDKAAGAHTKRNRNGKTTTTTNNNNEIDIVGFSLIGASSVHNTHQSAEHSLFGSADNQNMNPYSVADSHSTSTSSSYHTSSQSHIHYKQANHDSKHSQWQHNEQEIDRLEKPEWMSLFPQSSGMATVYLPYFWRQWLRHAQRQSSRVHIAPSSQSQQELLYPSQHGTFDKETLSVSVQSDHQVYSDAVSSHSSEQTNSEQIATSVNNNDIPWRQMNEYMMANDLYILYPSLPDHTEFAKMHSTQSNVNEGVAATAKVSDAVISESDDDDGLVNNYQFLTTHLPLNNIPRYYIDKEKSAKEKY